MGNNYELQIQYDDESETLQDLRFDVNRFDEAVIWSTDWTTETIFNQLKKGNIDLNPSFQRRDAWTDAEKSRLIESLMLGLPVPPIILAENKTKKNSYIVIDGKQRLLSIRKFFASEQPDEDFKQLKLKSLEILKEINGSTIIEARRNFPEYVRNLENQPIRTIVIKNWPDEPFLYTVFLRLNTGSKKLSPQELRQALKPGKFLDYLDEKTSTSQEIMKMLNNKGADPRMKDIELALRFYALHFYFDDYNGNLKEFLDSTCEKLNAKWEMYRESIDHLFVQLEDAIAFSYEVMHSSSPFSRYSEGNCLNRFNIPIFELFSYYFVDERIRDAIKKDPEEFRRKFIAMNDKTDFINAVSSSTKNTENVSTRFSCFYKLLAELNSVKDADLMIPQVMIVDGRFTNPLK